MTLVLPSSHLPIIVLSILLVCDGVIVKWCTVYLHTRLLIVHSLTDHSVLTGMCCVDPIQINKSEKEREREREREGRERGEREREDYFYSDSRPIDPCAGMFVEQVRFTNIN